MVNDLLEPLKVYNSQYKELFKEKTVEYFDNLVKVSNVDIEANRKTIKEYKSKLKELEKTNKTLRKKKTCKVLLIILIVLLAIIAFFAWFYYQSDITIPLIMSIIAVLIDAGLIVLICLKINKDINQFSLLKDNLERRIEALKQDGYSQMYSLNQLYDWNIPATIVNSTNDIIKMDKYFDVSKFAYMNEKFDFKENTKENVSTYFVQSGSILGNPFIICKDYIQNFVDHVYTGSITIHWTERVKTKDGWKTVHRSQVLTASLVKPVPNYYYDTYLVYGNVAAPNLKFSRRPSNADELNEKQIEKKVRKEGKKLDKKAKNELMDDDPTTNYTRFGNDEFEVLFGGTNRNNELEYRLLFTPLAQQNILELIKTPTPYGDDFVFIKDKMINIISSSHSQTFNYRSDPSYFVDFDYDNAKSKFVNYVTKYFESFYFDLAPLISIPLYQQTKTIEYIYNEEYKTNMTSFEHEAISNSFDRRYLKHEDSITDAILKTRFVEKVDNADVVEIDAHSFYRIAHTDLIPRRGGDGRVHMVPVLWYEYIPLVKTTKMLIKENEITKNEFEVRSKHDGFKNFISTLAKNQYLYERGIFATLLSRIPNESDVENLNTYLYVNESKNIDETKEKVKKVVKEIINN